MSLVVAEEDENGNIISFRQKVGGRKVSEAEFYLIMEAIANEEPDCWEVTLVNNKLVYKPKF